MTFLPELRLDAIDVPENRARDFDAVWAEALKDIIREQGLLNPITVRQIGDRYSLIAGLHRYYAHLFMGDRETIAAVVSTAETDDQARLQEVMENLGRNELIALDRCHHLYELKQVWERMYPQARHGGDRGNQHTGGKSQSLALATDDTPIMGFARATADKIGLGPAAIKLAVKIWTGLVPTVRARLRGSDLARKQTELKAISELPATRQIKVVDLILGDEHREIDNVASALLFIEGGIKPNAHERLFRVIHEGFAKLPDDTLDRLLVENEERVVASLRRMGRI